MTLEGRVAVVTGVPVVGIAAGEKPPADRRAEPELVLKLSYCHLGTRFGLHRERAHPDLLDPAIGLLDHRTASLVESLVTLLARLLKLFPRCRPESIALTAALCLNDDEVISLGQRELKEVVGDRVPLVIVRIEAGIRSERVLQRIGPAAAELVLEDDGMGVDLPGVALRSAFGGAVAEVAGG